MTAWLIEATFTPDLPNCYWSGFTGDPLPGFITRQVSAWTEYPDRAIRFARQCDAEQVRDTLGITFARVHEHMWIEDAR